MPSFGWLFTGPAAVFATDCIRLNIAAYVSNLTTTEISLPPRLLLSSICAATSRLKSRGLMPVTPEAAGSSPVDPSQMAYKSLIISMLPAIPAVTPTADLASMLTVSDP